MAVKQKDDNEALKNFLAIFQAGTHLAVGNSGPDCWWHNAGIPPAPG